MSEDFRLKRLRMRAWRRGTKEMDLILGPFADDQLATMEPALLDTFEALLEENDHDLYKWVIHAAPAPAHYAAIMATITTSANMRFDAS